MIYKATAANIPIYLGASGLVLTAMISKDNGAFFASSGSITEIGNRWFTLSLTADEMNADNIAVHIPIPGEIPLDLSINTEADYTQARAIKLDNLDAAISSRSTLDAPAVWGYVTRTLTAMPSGELTPADVWSYATRTITDKTGFELIAAYEAAKTAASSGQVALIPTNPVITTDPRLNYLDAAISSRSTLTAADVWNNVTRTLTSVPSGSITPYDVWNYATRALTDKAGFELISAYDAAKTAASSGQVENVPNVVWDEPLAGHLTAGTAGKALSDSGATADPWSVPIPGAYAAGTAGHILGNKIPNIETIVTTINGLAVAIKAKTDNLPSDPTSETNATTNKNTLLAELNAIKSQTDKLQFIVNDVIATLNGEEVNLDAASINEIVSDVKDNYTGYGVP